MTSQHECSACTAKVPELEVAFKANTVRKRSRYGWSVSCIKGNWSVTALTLAVAEREARHYFGQCLEDGEYG